MTQPPLSYQMKLLEEELGAQLFKRGSQCIELTEAGRLLARRAQQLLDMADNTVREIDEHWRRASLKLASCARPSIPVHSTASS